MGVNVIEFHFENRRKELRKSCDKKKKIFKMTNSNIPSFLGELFLMSKGVSVVPWLLFSQFSSSLKA